VDLIHRLDGEAVACEPTHSVLKVCDIHAGVTGCVIADSVKSEYDDFSGSCVIRCGLKVTHAGWLNVTRDLIVIIW